MRVEDYRKTINIRPEYLYGGSEAFFIPKKLIENDDEKALGIKFILDRRLFGLCYRQLLPEYFDSMPKNSGVLIRGFVQTANILNGVSFPGDIDLVIIPYEGDALVLSKALAVELKIVRASFAKQGKSPNEFGFSQAQALIDAGFPYVAVGHLIISDQSPPENWRKVGLTRIKNSETGECEELTFVDKDLMPSDLIQRCFGRLKKNNINSGIGFFSCYLADDILWQPEGTHASSNQKTTINVLDSIWNYYCLDAKAFFDTRRYD